MGDKIKKVPCETCEGGFHDVSTEELKKFTNLIHNPPAELYIDSQFVSHIFVII